VAGAFRFLFRVRYQECDAVKIVFNARWGDYVDLATGEYLRALFGTTEPDGINYRVVRQLIEWKGPARFDDVLEASVRTVRVGTTSFTLATEFRRDGEPALLASVETVYVSVDPPTGVKRPVTAEDRRALEAGAAGRTCDQSGATR
jgi:acyl-CoA thioester hydrolase